MVNKAVATQLNRYAKYYGRVTAPYNDTMHNNVKTLRELKSAREPRPATPEHAPSAMDVVTPEKMTTRAMTTRAAAHGAGSSNDAFIEQPADKSQELL